MMGNTAVALALAGLAFFIPNFASASNIPISAIEYYDLALDHYFLSAGPDEIAALNTGRFFGWVPTGLSFPVLPADATDPASTPVCRFYGNPAVGLDSHFYSASPAECAEVLRRFPGAWLLESPSVFRVYLPDLGSGQCPAGTKPIYRLWNGRSDSNHRYTDSLSVVATMERLNYVSEGYGPHPATAFCAPIGSQGPAAVSCTVAASNTAPVAGASITLTATCTGSPISYGWGGCTSATASCVATSAAAGSRTYTVSASNSTSTSAPAAITVNWQALAPPPSTVSCALASSNSSPVVGTSITLVATCTGIPTSYKWVGCTSSSNTCAATSTIAGNMSYSVAASNGTSASAPTTISVNWQPASPPPPSTVSCTLAASNATPVVNSSITLTAACTGNPTSYAWVGCTSATTTCVATLPVAGSKTYSMTASSGSSTSSPATVSVNWGTAAPPSTVSCTLATSNAAPVVGSSITSTATCTGSPTSYSWTGCTSSTGTCVATSSVAGTTTYSLSASNGSSTSSPASINVNWQSTSTPPPPTGATGAWTRYATGPATVNEAPKQTWYNLAWDTKRNRAYGISWLKTLSAFDPAIGRWTDLSVTSGINDFHNRSIAYDPLNDRLWASDGTGLPAGFQYYDFNTGHWSYLCSACGQPSDEAAMIYDPVGKRLVAFGGWQLAGVSTFALQPVGTTWQSAFVSGGPTYATDIQKMTAWRSTLDSSRNRILYVDTDGSLWALPLSLSGWQRLSTSGGVPPATMQFIYDVANDALVGWSASPDVVTGDNTPGSTQETWLLPLATLTWSRAANAAHGDVVPVSAPYVGYSMVYDPVRAQTLLHAIAGGDEYSPQTWFYRYPTGNPPPPTSVSCTLSASNSVPYLGSSITLIAACTGSPTSLTWVGCASSSSTCAATSSVAGSQTYSMTASNGTSTSSPASVTVNWQSVVQPPTITGNWAAARLPDIPNSGAAVAPFMYYANTKHVAMVEVAPGKVAVYGGDYTGAPYEDSYRQDSWTLDVATGTWTQRGAYTSPDPRPHRPDTMGIGWDAQKQRIIFVPGVITEGVGEVWSHYPDGHWVQETHGFGGTGMIRGGVVDWQTRRWLAFTQSQTLGTIVQEWDVDTWQSVAKTPWPGQSSIFTEYVEQSLPTIVGRYVYFIAQEVHIDETKPVRFFRWNIDTRHVEQLADPPVPYNTPESTLLATSGNKVVWPYILGPEGAITKVLVYNTTTGIWSEDTGRPALGNSSEFLANSVCSLSDGSVFMAGSAFNTTRQTHWFLRLP